MAFASIQESRDLGKPYELYLFRYGSQSAASYAYTNSTEEIVHLGLTFKHLPIDRDPIVAKQSLDKSQMTLRMPRDASLAALYNIQSPSYVVTLTIYQGHYDDPDGEHKVVWTGRVQSVKKTASRADVVCTPASASLKRVGLRYHYQHPCQHPLYGTECKANKLAATITRTVLEVGDDFVRFAPDWFAGMEEQGFRYGIVEWTTADNIEYRSILQVLSGGILKITNRPTGLVAGMSAKLSLGCNHQVSDCKTLHNNLQNYGGMPYIPLKNPINRNNHS